MRINSKGFVLIETLAVTVFAASIFVFLFKSVAPLMGFYNTRMEQMGSIDSVFNNYTLRKFIYRDEYFNNKSTENCDSTSSTTCKQESHQFAIKDLDYTIIRCRVQSRTGLTGTDRILETGIYSKEYCNSLMEQMGARERVTDELGDGYLNHYLIFYVNESKLNDFINVGIRKYKDARIKLGYREDLTGRVVSDNRFSSAVFDDTETVELFESAIKEVTDKLGPTPDSSKGYLIFYYLYPNPMYNGTADEPAYKESINILPMTPSDNNKNCFKTQIIPGYKYFYKHTYTYSNTDRNNNMLYYFYHDRNSGTSDNQFYTIYRISDYASSGETKCMRYFKDKIIESSGKMNASQLRQFCYTNKFKNLDLQSDWENFVHARFAEKTFDLTQFNYDGSNNSLPAPQVAIIGYDSSCSKDVIIPTKMYGYDVTVIGYEAFKNTGIRTIKLNNVKVVDKNALNLFSSSAISNYVGQTTSSRWHCVGDNKDTGCFNGVLFYN